MPAATEYLDPNSLKRTQLELLPDNERRRRTELYEQAQSYYDGEHPRTLEVEENEFDDNVVINMIQQEVDRINSFIVPSMPKFQIDPTTETPDEIWLNEAWVFNDGPLKLAKIVQNGALSGHWYTRILPIEDGDEYPRIINIHPTQIVTFWKWDDMETPLWHEQKWEVGKTGQLTDFVRDPVTKKWTIYEYTKDENGRDWVLVNTVDWPYQSPPIVQKQHLPNNNSFYGRSDVPRNQIQLNIQLNKVVSDINRILRYHAAPKTILTGGSANDIQPSSIGSLYAIANPEANIKNLEMDSDLSASIQFFNTLYENHLAQARVVIMKGTVKDFQRVTNTGIRAVFLDMLAKNVLLRWAYGSGLQDISAAMLEVGGRQYVRPTIIWPDPLPQDDTEAINTLAIERAIEIVSRRTAAAKRGYNWEEEKQNMEDEQDSGLFDQANAPQKDAQGGLQKPQDDNQIPA